MGTYAQFKNDEKYERDGVTLDLGDAGKFKIARAGGANKRFEKAFSKAMRPYRRRIETNTVTNDELQKEVVKVFAKTVILGWEGVTGKDGNDLPFTYENCVTVMTDLPDLFREIHEAATEQALFREQISEDDAKN